MPAVPDSQPNGDSPNPAPEWEHSESEEPEKIDEEHTEIPHGRRPSQWETPNVREVKEKPVEVDRFTDNQDRQIAMRTEQTGDTIFIRAYDANKERVPDHVDIGQAGNLDMHIERDVYGGKTLAKLNHVGAGLVLKRNAFWMVS
jgi:hypothetical protein